MRELVEIFDAILAHMTDKIKAGLKREASGNANEDSYRQLCVLHFLVQEQHGRFLAPALPSWDAALIARAAWETNLTLRWVQLDKPTNMPRVQAWGVLYDYETLQEKKKDGETIDTADEDKLIVELNTHFSNEVFSNETKRELAASPNPTCTDFKKTKEVLPDVRKMVTEVWPDNPPLAAGVTPKRYRTYQRLSEWTHGASAGLRLMVEKKADDSWMIKRADNDWLGWSMGLLTRAMIHTASAVAEFDSPADLPPLETLKARLEAIFPE